MKIKIVKRKYTCLKRRRRADYTHYYYSPGEVTHQEFLALHFITTQVKTGTVTEISADYSLN